MQIMLHNQIYQIVPKYKIPGTSFYTIHTLKYVMNIRNNQKPIKSLVNLWDLVKSVAIL